MNATTRDALLVAGIVSALFLVATIAMTMAAGLSLGARGDSDGDADAGGRAAGFVRLCAVVARALAGR